MKCGERSKNFQIGDEKWMRPLPTTNFDMNLNMNELLMKHIYETTNFDMGPNINDIRK